MSTPITLTVGDPVPAFSPPAPAPTGLPHPPPMPATGPWNITSTVHRWITGGDDDGDNLARMQFVMSCQSQHTRGLDGTLDPQDREANEAARKQNSGRVLSSYPFPVNLRRTGQDTLWIITDGLGIPDQTYTTILFPSDY